MSPLKKACFVYFILILSLFMNSYGVEGSEGCTKKMINKEISLDCWIDCKKNCKKMFGDGTDHDCDNHQCTCCYY